VVERFYSGEPGGQVTVRDDFTITDGKPKRSLDHQPDQLALALLADALGDDDRALQFHQDFNRRVVSIFPARWTITRSRIIAYVNMIELKQLTETATPAQLAEIRLDAYGRRDLSNTHWEISGSK